MKISRSITIAPDAVDRILPSELPDDMAILTHRIRAALGTRAETRPAPPVPPAFPWLGPVMAIGIDEPPAAPWVLLEGHTPLRLLVDAARSMRTGALVVACGDSHKAMFFREGWLSCIASDHPDHHLGEQLVAHRTISEEQRQEALDFSERTDLAFGRTLFVLGILSFDQVIDAIREKVEAEIADFATWSECRWFFVEREPARLNLIHLAIDVRELRAVRTATEPLPV
jgi:hypothetical protein